MLSFTKALTSGQRSASRLYKTFHAPLFSLFFCWKPLSNTKFLDTVTQAARRDTAIGEKYDRLDIYERLWRRQEDFEIILYIGLKRISILYNTVYDWLYSNLK